MSARRLAFFTPLNPKRTGISDHSEELLPHIADAFGARAEIDVVIDDYEPMSEAIRDRFRIIGVDAFMAERDGYDVAIYQIGNNFEHHAYMMEPMRAVPGIVVLQDYCLEYLALGVTVGQGDLRGLRELLRHDYGERAGAMARRILLGAANTATISFARPFVEMSRAVIVHSSHCLECVERDHPGVPVSNIVMGVTPIDPADPEAQIRTRYGFAPDDLVLASVSTLSAKKRLDVVLAALQRLRRELPQLRFLVVGGGALGSRVRRMIHRFGLDDVVRTTGWVPADEYRDLIRLSDIVLDLRETTGVETPNSLLRAMGAAKPAVVTAEGPFLEVPDDACIKVPVGGELEPLIGAIMLLARDRALRQRMAEAAGVYVRRDLSLTRTAEGYVQFLDAVLHDAAGAEGTVAAGSFAVPPPARMRTRLVKATYRLCRIGVLYRQYGLMDTVRRVRSELTRRRGQEATAS